MTITIRDAAEADIPAIFEIRTSVRENHLTVQQMAEIGIRDETIRHFLYKEPCIWVAVHWERILGFPMGDAADACLFAALVHPECEGKVSDAVYRPAEAFLVERHSLIWLRTDGSSRAACFYERLDGTECYMWRTGIRDSRNSGQDWWLRRMAVLEPRHRRSGPADQELDSGQNSQLKDTA